MTTVEISRFVDKKVHRSAYVVCLGKFVLEQWFGIFDNSLAANYAGSARRKLLGNA